MPVQNRRLDWVGGGEYSSCLLCSQPNPPPLHALHLFHLLFLLCARKQRGCEQSIYCVLLAPFARKPHTPPLRALGSFHLLFLLHMHIQRGCEQSLFIQSFTSRRHDWVLECRREGGPWSQGRGGQWCQPLWPQWGRHRSVNDREPQSPLDLHYKEFGTVTILWCFRDKIFFK